MAKVKEFINRIKAFLAANPKRAKFIGIIAIATLLPLIVAASLTVQNLKQHAGGGTIVRISDSGGNTLYSTSDPNVFIDINLNADSNWMVGPGVGINNLVKKAFAVNIDSEDGSNLLITTPSLEPTLEPTATPVPPAQAPFLPQSVGNCGNQNCSSNQTCIGTSYDNSTFCISKGTGGVGSYCGTPKYGYPNNEACASGICGSDSRCVNKPNPITEVSTPSAVPSVITPSNPPTPNLLKYIYIENKDTDGSTGGSAPIKIAVNSSTDIAHIAWKLNDLLPGQTQASRTVQVTLIGDNIAVPYTTTVNLVGPNGRTNIPSRVDVSFDCPNQVSIGRECHGSALMYDTGNYPMYEGVTYSWGISSSNSIATLSRTNENITSYYAHNIGTGVIWVIAQQGSAQVQKSFDVQVVKSINLVPTPTIPQSLNANYDLNHDGAVNCKDTQILIGQYGQKGTNLPSDFNKDGIVDGIDYNTILRNYTLGDTTKCQ